MKIKFLLVNLFIVVLALSCSKNNKADATAAVITPQAVEDKKWKLTELNGNPVNGTAETHYFILHGKDKLIEATAGCNMLSYQYEIKDGLHFSIKPGTGVSSKMACPDNTEDLFKAAITAGNNLAVNGTTLSLNKDKMAPLAKFELVAGGQ
jgi:heat shock protein HslJ